ncbi:uncharacterized protein EDB91DRAFT_52491 [Suillus paluster]|uniref:uncharacterized protein n=1 Tax=Suillus paluster TaxID=48578 RepID=UPI001B8683C8|nr:uncharacterized protein EDB91DRAFT_52491 [Suillus paluster]KAG1747976.1 hypothetical protein EDB91DRAFT_52491 [Suillus paluster]
MACLRPVLCWWPTAVRRVILFEFVLANNMQTIEDIATANSEVKLSLVSDIIGALANILARSREIDIIPDLETPHSKLPDTDQLAMHKDQSISATITKHQQQLDAVLHEISGLETVMDGMKDLHHQLVEKKDKITQSMNVYKGLVSPVRRLPTEVLSQIFDHCLPEDSRLLSPSMEHAPMLLTGICRRWREVAVGVPSLWRRLYVEVDDDGNWQDGTFCHDLWLKRSRGCPISLELDCYANDLTELRSLFQPYINQISSLSIYFSGETDETDLLLEDLPALRELAIKIDFALELDILSVTQSISQLPSTMRSLKVVGLLFDARNLSSLDPLWFHLTNVEISIRHPNAFLRLLQLCPSLSSLKVRAKFDLVQTLEPFTHTEIQSLRIDFNSEQTRSLSDLFGALSLPNLRVLEVRYIEKWPHKKFKAFLARSKCPLERLAFGGIKMMADEQRAEYVDLFPSVAVIVLDPVQSIF